MNGENEMKRKEDEKVECEMKKKELVDEIEVKILYSTSYMILHLALFLFIV